MELRSYQQEDVAELLKHDSYGVFNEQRTGKTPTAIVAMINKVPDGRIVIVCPASMVYVWRTEILQWADRPVAAYAGTKKQRELTIEGYKEIPNAIIIMSYEMFKPVGKNPGMIDIINTMKPKGLIIDEVHRAVGRKTSNFKAINRMRRTPFRLYLTGTPAPNHPSQTWSILHFIDPKEFSSYWRFVEEFFETETQRLPAHVARLSGIDSKQVPLGFLPGKEDEYVALLNKYSIMRKRKDVMPWILDMAAPTRVKLLPTPTQVKLLDSMHTTYRAEHIITQGTLDQLLRERQICVDPGLLNLKGGSPKTDWLLEYLKDYPDYKVIVFSRFTQYLKILHKKIPGAGVIVGDTPLQKRKEYIDSFQNKDMKVLLIQVDAGKEGLTLDAADTLVFTDVYPPASDILQARDRLIATSVERNTPKQIIELMLEYTYDEVLYDLVDMRVELTDVANNYIHYLKGGK